MSGKFDEKDIDNTEGFRGDNSQRFQMLEKPYQSYIDRKNSLGKGNFSFVPPRKNISFDELSGVPENSISGVSQGEFNLDKPEPAQTKAQGEILASGDLDLCGGFSQVSRPAEDSLPNPYGSDGWGNPHYPAVHPAENCQGDKKSSGKKGLVIFLAVTGLLLCAAALLYCAMIFPGGENEKEESQGEYVPQYKWEESREYIKYLRDDVSIELVPQLLEEDASAEKAYERILPSTVLIISSDDRIESRGGDTSQGTGVIIHSDGYIVTNSHVIDNTRDGYIVVVDNEGNIDEAVVVGYDTDTDIAVIKIDKTGLQPAEFAETENLKVGQEVVALGNPDGVYFRNSLSKGIISAVGRRIDSETGYIQVDAAINPGNSGGPLCNMEGQIIGINTSKLAKENYEGIAFAIPSDTVREVANDIIKYGRVKKSVSLGIYGYGVPEGEGQDIPSGVFIESIIEGGSADKSPLEPGDIVVSIDGEKIDGVEDIRRILDGKSFGEVINVEYMRLVSEEGKSAEWELNSCGIELRYS